MTPSLRFRALLIAAALAAAACSSGASSPSALATTEPSTPATTAPKPSLVAVNDGEPWLLYSWYLPGANEKDLFLARSDGSDAHQILTDLPGTDGQTSPAWAPDGSQFAFNYGTSIWTANPDGSGAAPLTDGEGQCPDGIHYADWSPDGSKLAVICYPDPGGKQGSVATFDVATKTLTRLTTVDWPEHLDNPPRWSPDGESIAFSIQQWDPTDQFLVGSLVAVIPAAGGEARRLTPFETFMAYPDWAPDGSEIVMHDYDFGNMHDSEHPSNLYMIGLDGTGQRQLTHSSVDGNMRIGQPRWSADGERLVVSIGVSGAGNQTLDDVQLALVDPAGGEPVLFSPTIHGSQPDLRPTP